MGALQRRQEEIESLAEPVCAAHGVELVEVRQIRNKSGWTLQVTIDRERADGKPGSGVTLKDCTAVSRDLSTALDVHEDLIPGAYHLEVGSPGPERPLVKLDDFIRFSGNEIRVRTRDPLPFGEATRRNFQGPLLGVSGADIRLDLEGTEFLIPHQAIERAHLVPRF